MDEDEFLREEIAVMDEDEELLGEERLNSLDPWEIAFEEGVRQAQDTEFDDDWEADFE